MNTAWADTMDDLAATTEKTALSDEYGPSLHPKDDINPDPLTPFGPVLDTTSFLKMPEPIVIKPIETAVVISPRHEQPNKTLDDLNKKISVLESKVKAVDWRLKEMSDLQQRFEMLFTRELEDIRKSVEQPFDKPQPQQQYRRRNNYRHNNNAWRNQNNTNQQNNQRPFGSRRQQTPTPQETQEKN